MNYHTEYLNELEEAITYAEDLMHVAQEVCFRIRDDIVGRRKGKFEISVDQDSWNEAKEIAEEINN